jgi:hypothetical protein
MSHKAKVIYLHQLDPQAALERLNRLTGLQFTSWPQSLRPTQQGVAAQACGLVEAGVGTIAEALCEDIAAAEPLRYVALDALL